MIDNKTTDFLEGITKEAADSSTGMSQVKKKKQTNQRDFEGEGAGLGALIGAGAGALSKKYKPLTTAAGGVLGALTGREMGKRTIGTRRTSVTEGTVKRQERKPQGAEVPRLTDQKVLNLLKGDK